MRKVLFLLGDLRDSDVEWIIAQGRRLRVEAGTVLIQEGRSIDSLFILLDGALEVTGSSLSGGPIRLSSGEVVGEMSMLDSRPPVATVTAAQNSVVLALPRDRLSDKLQIDAEFAARFYRSLATFLSHRLRNVYQSQGDDRDQPLEDETQYADELSPELLDNVHLAAIRFDRALQRLLAGK